MFEYRQVLTGMRLGDTDRAIARAGLMGRRKAAQLRLTAEAAGWLDVAKALPGDGELAVHLGSGAFRADAESRLKVVDGEAKRANLEIVVTLTSASQRIDHIHRALETALEREGSGGAIVYCTLKRISEEDAQPLADRGLIAQHFRSGLSPDRKREIQRGFDDGDIDVVFATNAFGMGIVKPDVRAVVRTRGTRHTSMGARQEPEPRDPNPFRSVLPAIQTIADLSGLQLSRGPHRASSA